ncbi:MULTISPECIES: LacI family DNA-binding transcriptional regulator [unclassified Actinotalea]|uniref:LacI family DNA-binding transcriptional regulator n=1 Tax=unclassified Actinotalea TaxID=2638618 RepID=UPI0015F72B0A|nr:MULTISPECIES: LacI family DNA-binding transcriptional regulator [unclassified Actinotalea]
MPPDGPAGSSRRPATIADVARVAGVSRATVSRVMNGRVIRDTEVALRVRRVVRELEYSPSSTAQSLSLGVTHTVAIVLPDLGNPMFQQILRGLNAAAATAGYRVLVCDSEEDPSAEEALVREARRRSDAVVVCSSRLPYDDLRALLSTVTPAVAINRQPDLADVPVVTIDYERATRALVEHLLDLGHRRLAYLQGPSSSRPNRARLRALSALEREHDALEVTRLSCGVTLDAGYAAWPAVAAAGATAVVAYNDVVALGLLARLGEEQVPVPGRLSVVGFDDIAFSRFSAPPLTTVRVSLADVGAAAWREVEALLHGVATQGTTHFVPELTVRRSTGPAPGGPA